MTAILTVRSLDSNGDPLQGNGQDNFISDLQAVAQIIKTRLLLFEGEWFLDLLDGLPLSQSILGSSGSQRNLEIVLNLISTRIQGFQPYVTGISSLSASYTNRQFIYSGTAQTIFGPVYFTNAPGTSATLTSS